MTEHITAKIIEKVASTEHVEPSELPPLYHSIDTDALSRIVETEPIRVEFEYLQYTVVVTDKDVTVH